MTYSQILQNLIDEQIIRGAVLMAGHGKEIKMQDCLGNARDGVAMKMDSLFDIASITKPLATGTACACCHSKGLLDFEQAVVNYLPECRGRISEKVTLGHLATHTSGLNYERFTDATMRPEEIFSTLTQECPPDTAWTYTCLEYIVLGLIVERVSGLPLDQFCQKHIFQPLQMDDTVWGPVPCSDRVTHPEVREAGLISDWNANLMSHHNRAIGNAGVFSTAADLARFCNFLLTGQPAILSEPSRAQLTENRLKGADLPPHAFGWNMNPDFIPEWMSPHTIYHSGWAGCSVWIDMQNNNWVIVLTPRYGDYTKAKQGRLAVANDLGRRF